MQVYRDALRLLEEASDKMEQADDTLVVAHLALPISLVRERLADRGIPHDRR